MADPGRRGVTDWGAEEGPSPADGFEGLGPTGVTELRTADGGRVSVPNDQVDSAFRTGRVLFERGRTVPIVDETGALGQVASDDLAAYLTADNRRSIALGSRLEQGIQQQTQRARAERHGSLGGAITSAVQNALVEVLPWEEANHNRRIATTNQARLDRARETGGIFVEADDALNQGRENNPIVSTLGRAVPWVGVALATEGLGVAGGGLLGGAEGTIARVLGRQVATSAERTLARAGIEAGRAAQLGSLAGRTAVTLTENAAFGALASERERMAAEAPFSAEAMLRDVGMSALLGLAVEGGIAGLSAGARSVSSVANKATRRAVDEAAFFREQATTAGPSPLVEGTPTELTRARRGNIASGASVDDLVQFQQRSNRLLASEAAPKHADLVTDAARQAVELRNVVDNALESRLMQIVSQADSAVPEETLLGALIPIESLAKKLPREVFDNAHNEGFRKYLVDSFESFYSKYLGEAGELVKDVPLPTLMRDIHSFKRSLRHKLVEFTGEAGASPDLARIAAEMDTTVTGVLRDEGLFGAAAGEYGKWNDSTRVALSGLDNFTGAVTKLREAPEVIKDPITGKLSEGTRFDPKPGAIESLTTSFDKAGSGVSRELLDDNIAAMMEGLSGLSEAGMLSADDFARAQTLSETFRNTRDLAARIGTAKRLRERVLNAEGAQRGLFAQAGITPQSGLILGGAWAGGPVGAAVGGLAGLAVTSLARLGRTIDNLDHLERSTRSLFVRMDKSLTRIGNVLDGKVQYVPRAGAFAPRIWDHKLSEEKKNELYLTMADNVRRLAGDTNALTETLGQTIPTSPTIEPMSQRMAAATARGVQYLNSVLPSSLMSPLSGKHERLPSTTERDAFLRAAAGVDDPLLILEGLANGGIPPETVAAIQAVHPEFYAYAQQRVTQMLVGSRNRSNYTFRIQLSNVLGIPADTTLTPDMMAALQSRYAQTSMQAQAQGMVRTPARSINAASATYSEFQQIQGRR